MWILILILDAFRQDKIKANKWQSSRNCRMQFNWWFVCVCLLQKPNPGTSLFSPVSVQDKRRHTAVSSKSAVKEAAVFRPSVLSTRRINVRWVIRFYRVGPVVKWSKLLTKYWITDGLCAGSHKPLGITRRIRSWWRRQYACQPVPPPAHQRHTPVLEESRMVSRLQHSLPLRPQVTSLHPRAFEHKLNVLVEMGQLYLLWIQRGVCLLRQRKCHNHTGNTKEAELWPEGESVPSPHLQAS